MKPSIGRIVHFVLADGQHRAAIVVNCWPSPDSVQASIANLTVHLDHANDFQTSTQITPTGWDVKPQLIPQGTGAFVRGAELHAASAKQDEEGKAPGTWHWPERE